MKKTKGLLTSFLYLMLSTHCSTALSYETHARILYTTKLSNIDYNRDYPEADRIFFFHGLIKQRPQFFLFLFVRFSKECDFEGGTWLSNFGEEAYVACIGVQASSFEVEVRGTATTAFISTNFGERRKKA